MIAIHPLHDVAIWIRVGEAVRGAVSSLGFGRGGAIGLMGQTAPWHLIAFQRFQIWWLQPRLVCLLHRQLTCRLRLSGSFCLGMELLPPLRLVGPWPELEP